MTFTLISERNRRVILESEDKEGLIKVCRDMNELDTNKPLGVNNFKVEQGNDVVYGE